MLWLGKNNKSAKLYKLLILIILFCLSVLWYIILKYIPLGYDFTIINSFSAILPWVIAMIFLYQLLNGILERKWRIKDLFEEIENICIKNPREDQYKLAAIIRELNTERIYTINLKGARLMNSYLNGAILRNSDLSHTDCYATKLAKARLVGSNFAKSNLRAANFRLSQLEDADLHSSNLINCLFERAFMSCVNMKSVDATGANFKFSNMAFFVGRQANFSGAKFVGANLRNSIIDYCNFSLADLSKTNLSYADLTGSNLTGSIMVGANLTHAYMADAVLDMADLSHSVLIDTRVTFKQLKNVYSLDGAVMMNGQPYDELWEEIIAAS
jgi:uncharacterized protein YjbI with pentapeptide repeats